METFDIWSVLLGGLIGSVLGFLGSMFANYYTDNFKTIYNKLKKIARLDTQYHEILEQRQEEKIFEDVIFLDVGSDAFSGIASGFLDHEKNNHFIITNIQEPHWFYDQFKKKVTDPNNGDEESSLLISEYETLCANFNQNMNGISDLIKKLIDLYYKNGKLNIFPHLRAFAKREINNRYRISFIDFNPDAPSGGTSEKPNARNLYRRKNTNYQVYFFERFINYRTNSLFVNRNDYHEGKFRGTDALILNNKIVINHDSSIGELMYLNKDLVRGLKSGFFHILVKDLKEYCANNSSQPFFPTSHSFKQMYGINIE